MNDPRSPSMPNAAPPITWPGDEGYQLPAEWDAQSAVWLSWPHNEDTWPDCRQQALSEYADLVATLTRYQTTCLIVPNHETQEMAQSLLATRPGKPENLRFFIFPTDDAWCRDHGPIFLRHRQKGDLALTDWEYNGWGNKFASSRDNAIPRQVAEALHLPCYDLPYVLEGGSLETDGQGTLLTTTSCLLNPNRNPACSRDDLEMILKRGLGISSIWWLGDGILGDDTDGHIDDITRFGPHGIILTAREEDPADENYLPLEENYRQLQKYVANDVVTREILTLPMPDPLFHKNRRLPASYANYLVINGAVLLPVFDQPAKDRQAAEILGKAFPDRTILPLPSTFLIRESGSFHCLTQQQPAPLNPS